MLLVGSFGYLELCLYGNTKISTNQSTVSQPMRVLHSSWYIVSSAFLSMFSRFLADGDLHNLVDLVVADEARPLNAHKSRQVEGQLQQLVERGLTTQHQHYQQLGEPHPAQMCRLTSTDFSVTK